MKLIISGGSATRTCEWSGYALLRDNVQHFLEDGEPTARFSALHSIERAVDDGEGVVEAGRLRGEVLRAWYALSRIRLQDAAVSLRTRAILTGSADMPAVRGTVRAERVGWQLPVDPLEAIRVVDAARSFTAAVLELTANAVDGDTLAVRRDGSPPRFAAKPNQRGHSLASAGHGLARLGLKSLLVAVLAAGCGGSLPPVEASSPAVLAEQEASERSEERGKAGEEHPLVAPPPAYGNKVVKLHARSTVSVAREQ
jgi:hypothetical protein